MVNRKDFVKDLKEYGEIISTSHDGLSYIFKKKNKPEFSILELSFEGFKFIKKIDMIDYLKRYIEENNMKNGYDDLFEDGSWVYDQKRCICNFMLNND